MSVWNKAEAVAFVADFGALFCKYGFRTEIVGSVAVKGYSLKDLDLLLTPLHTEFDTEGLLLALEQRKIQWRDNDPSGPIELRLPDARIIDLFFAEEQT